MGRSSPSGPSLRRSPSPERGDSPPPKPQPSLDPPPEEALEDSDRSRSQHHHEQGGEDAQHQREQDLHRHLHRLMLGPLSPTDPKLPRLGLQHVGHADLENLPPGACPGAKPRPPPLLHSFRP